MDAFRRLNRVILLPMVFILPFWITFGRAIFGSQGWGTLLFIFTLAPLLCLVLLAFYFLLRSRGDIKFTKKLGMVDSFLMTGLYVSVILFGFFYVDTAGNIDVASQTTSNSVSFDFFGSGFAGAANTLAWAFFDLSIAIALVILVVLLYERFRKPLS
jgi:hypothetical protein